MDRAILPLLVCILSEGDWDETNRAVRSARRFSLPVLVGLAGETVAGAPEGQTPTVPIPWHDHFAQARNALTEKAQGRYLLWLDSDEELARFALPDPASLDEPLYAALIEDRWDLAPREALRLVRNDGSVRWHGAIHEAPRTSLRPRGWRAPLLAGLLIVHHGYADDAAIAASLERNRRIVQAQRRKGRDDFALALEEARYAEASGQGSALLWLRAFNHPAAPPSAPGGYDRRVEPAQALCDYGLTGPARAVLNDNPAIAELHLALLAAHYRVTGRLDEARLASLRDLVERGRADTRYSWPKGLKGASRDRIIALVGDAAGAQRERHGAPSPGTTGQPAMTTLYRRSGAFDCETLDDDLVVMNTASGAVVTLNQPAQAIWQALEGGASGEELLATFREAFPKVAPERLRQDIGATLEALLRAGLIVADETP